jgi:hypothetical protein
MSLPQHIYEVHRRSGCSSVLRQANLSYLSPQSVLQKHARPSLDNLRRDRALKVKAEELWQIGHSWVGFCELDSDLQPWNRNGERRSILGDLYDNARIWVYGDFLLEEVNELPSDWAIVPLE